MCNSPGTPGGVRSPFASRTNVRVLKIGLPMETVSPKRILCAVAFTVVSVGPYRFQSSRSGNFVKVRCVRSAESASPPSKRAFRFSRTGALPSISSSSTLQSHGTQLSVKGAFARASSLARSRGDATVDSGISHTVFRPSGARKSVLSKRRTSPSWSPESEEAQWQKWCDSPKSDSSPGCDVLS